MEIRPESTRTLHSLSTEESRLKKGIGRCVLLFLDVTRNQNVSHRVKQCSGQTSLLGFFKKKGE